MNQRHRSASIAKWDGQKVAPGETRNIRITIGESYLGASLRIPVQVRRGKLDGPTVFVSAALHGDELNGTGIIRELIRDEDLTILRGGLILVPVLNLPGFERHARYLPDRRDLNRCFPGSSGGSLARRMAQVIFQEIVGRSDFGIDLHTAAIRRTNFPNIRGDMSNDAVQRLVKAIGTVFVLDGAGPNGSLRRAATDAGCPTIVFEAGEAWKVEPSITAAGVRGIRRVLVELGMIDGPAEAAGTQLIIQESKWIRAERGGFLQFHVRPGGLVPAGTALATNTSLLGKETNTLTAPFDGVVIGMTTLPAVSPGEPICHLGKLSDFKKQRKDLQTHMRNDDLHGQLIDDLATNLIVTDKQTS